MKNTTLKEGAKELRSQYRDTENFVAAIGRFIREHANTLPRNYEPKSIIESRFTPAEEAFERGMLSCGAMVNIATEMLRSVGMKVKLIHGEHKNSVDHAWFSVLDPETNEWQEYDLTADDNIVPDTNIKKLEVDSWDEIKDQIIQDHATLRQRRRERKTK